MFGFLKGAKNSLNRGMCAEAVAAARSVLEAMDEAVSYEHFKWHVSQLKYDAGEARKYFERTTWDSPSDEILAEGDVEDIEKQAEELGNITEELFQEMMAEDADEIVDEIVDEDGAEAVGDAPVLRQTVEPTEGACKKCGKTTDSQCACADWLCEGCSLGRHPEYGFIMCEDCKRRSDS